MILGDIPYGSPPGTRAMLFSWDGSGSQGTGSHGEFYFLADGSAGAPLALTSAFHFLQHKHFCFPFFLNKMPGTDSLLLFSAEVELTAEQRTSLAGGADAWAGALPGLVPKAASSQPSGEQESDCLDRGTAGYDHAEASGKSSFLCSTFFPC